MCCMTKRFPSCPSFNSLSLCKPSEGVDKWGIVGINAGPVLQGATGKKKNSSEMVRAQTDSMCFLFLRRSLSGMFVLSSLALTKIIAHVLERFIWKLSRCFSFQSKPSIQLRRPVFSAHGGNGQVHSVQNANLRPPLQQTVCKPVTQTCTRVPGC